MHTKSIYKIQNINFIWECRGSMRAARLVLSYAHWLRALALVVCLNKAAAIREIYKGLMGAKSITS